MHLSLSSIILLVGFWSSTSLGYTNSSKFENETSQFKAIVFLSASCPCSKSHVSHLNELNASYSDFKLYGVITDDLEGSNKEKLKKYYSDERFKFPIINDPKHVLVKKYNALKTPHVVLLKKEKNGTFKKVYEGGVTDERKFSQSKHKFLAEDLLASKQGKPIPYAQGRSLGCYIRRF